MGKRQLNESIIFCVFFQGGIGEKGAEGTAGNDGARVSKNIPFLAGLGTNITVS